MQNPETVTLEIGGGQITVEKKDLFAGWMANAFSIIPGQILEAIEFPFNPNVPTLLEGEEYAGIIIGKNGERGYHLVLAPGEKIDIDWDDSMKEGQLPNRREQALLYANLSEHFKDRYYWSSEQHAGSSLYAWGQTFGNGHQFYSIKNFKLAARFVRRIPR